MQNPRHRAAMALPADAAAAGTRVAAPPVPTRPSSDPEEPEGADRIRLLLAVRQLDGEHDVELARALRSDPTLTVVGWVGTGDELLDAVVRLRPDVVLVDCSLKEPRALQSVAAVGERYPWVSTILLTDGATRAEIRRAGKLGARDVLVRPIPDRALVACIQRIYHLDAARRSASSEWGSGPQAERRDGRVFTFFGAKGGLGCTTLATNTAVALKQLTGLRVALVDANLLFGDVAMLLDSHHPHSVADLSHTVLDDEDVIDSLLDTDASGIDVLLAPPSPERAELVTAKHLEWALRTLRSRYSYVVVDTWPSFDERLLHVLDATDRIVVPTTLELTAIKNTRLLLNILHELRYPSERIACVLNRAGSRIDVKAREAEQVLGQPFAARLPSDWRLAGTALGMGRPFTAASPDAPLSQAVTALAQQLARLPGRHAQPVDGDAGSGWAQSLWRTLRRASAAPGEPVPALVAP